MHKTTIYLPDDLRAAVKREAARRDRPEAEVIRDAIEAFVGSTARPLPRYGIVEGGGEPLAERVDELLAGFGER